MTEHFIQNPLQIPVSEEVIYSFQKRGLYESP